MDPQQGIVCSFTNAHATFSTECPDYNLDIATQRTDDTIPLAPNEISHRISADAFERLRMEQNLPLAIGAGIAVSLLGSILWAAISIATGYQIGYMAVAIGAGVGFIIRIAGNGVDPIFGYSGALIAVLGCVFGNFFSIIGFYADSEGLNYFETLFAFDYSYFIDVMTETFSIMDLLFYGIAGYEGYRFAFRQLTDKDLANLT